MAALLEVPDNLGNSFTEEQVRRKQLQGYFTKEQVLSLHVHQERTHSVLVEVGVNLLERTFLPNLFHFECVFPRSTYIISEDAFVNKIEDAPRGQTPFSLPYGRV